MKSWKQFLSLLAAVAAFGSLCAAEPLPEPPAPAEPGTLVVIDAGGKEQKLKAWKLVNGTRPLTWLAPAVPKENPEKKDSKEGAPSRKVAVGAEDEKPGVKKAPVGPEALAFREENSTDYQDGIVTLIPFDRIRTIDYDAEKRTVAVRVATTDKPAADELVSGTTKYLGTNRLTIEAEVDMGKLGIAEVKFLGGGGEKPIRAVRFPAPKASAAVPAGRPAYITIVDGKGVQKVSDLQPLYQFEDGSERLLSTVMFKKTLKLDVSQLQKLVAVEGRVPEGKEMDVSLKDGTSNTLTLLKNPTIDDKQATLIGFVGRVAGGYKLFPVHTFTEIQFDEMKEEKKPEKPEKKDGDKDK